VKQNQDHTYQVLNNSRTSNNFENVQQPQRELLENFQKKLKKKLTKLITPNIITVTFSKDFDQTYFFVKFDENLTAWIKKTTLEKFNPLAWKNLENTAISKWKKWISQS